MQNARKKLAQPSVIVERKNLLLVLALIPSIPVKAYAPNAAAV